MFPFESRGRFSVVYMCMLVCNDGLKFTCEQLKSQIIDKSNSIVVGRIFRYSSQSFAPIHSFSFQTILTKCPFAITTKCNVILHFSLQKVRCNVKTFFCLYHSRLEHFRVCSNGGSGTFYIPGSIPSKSTCEAIAKESHSSFGVIYLSS